MWLYFRFTLKRRRPTPSARWHLDEMVVNIRGKRMYLWRAVDDEGEVLDMIVQHRRDTVHEKQKLLARVRRIKGQVEAVERALDGAAGCDQVLHLIAGARGALAGLMAEVVEDHVRTHLVDEDQHPGALSRETLRSFRADAHAAWAAATEVA
jgi:DNA-binding FrmR family transcriptional regulator